MGSYLSKPVTTSVSEDKENQSLSYGASSMQGWRESQEDAHNCILEFDKDVSLFAVYDGHGGAEVAQYAAENLPPLVKNDLYNAGDYEKALIKAYLDFDDSLIEPHVADKLSTIRKQKNGVDSNDEAEDEDKEEEEKEELNDLYQEAKIPIEEILSRYKNKLLKNDNESNKSAKHPGSSTESQVSGLSSSSKDPSSNDCGSSSNDCGSSSNEVDTANTNEAKTNTENGVDGSDSSANVNGASVELESYSEFGPSSSNGQNGSGKRSAAAKLIGLETEDSDSDSDDDDDDDEIFEVSKDDNDESNSDTDDDFNGDDDDCEDIEDAEEEQEEDEDLSDILLGEEDETAGRDSGCTAVMALIVGKKLYVANAGDSRCVVSIDGKAHDMSKDHKPEDEPELKRITTAGGRVSSDGRVNGGLNLSRALGDHNYKKNENLPNTEQMITALPDVSELDLSGLGVDDFIVLACDGIWNSLNSQEVVDFIGNHINKPDIKLSAICEELFRVCLAPNTMSDGTGCDNMTCIIIKLTSNQKRARSEDAEEGSSGTFTDGVECKKPKLDSTEL